MVLWEVLLVDRAAVILDTPGQFVGIKNVDRHTPVHAAEKNEFIKSASWRPRKSNAPFVTGYSRSRVVRPRLQLAAKYLLHQIVVIEAI